MNFLPLIFLLAQSSTPCLWQRDAYADYYIQPVVQSERCEISMALDQIFADHQSVDVSDGSFGPVIEIAAGEYDMDVPTLIGMVTEIKGSGAGRTTVHTSSTAFVCLFQDEAIALGLGNGGQDCYIHDMTIRSNRLDTDVYHVGVWAKARPHLERLIIQRYVHGLRVKRRCAPIWNRKK